MTTDETRRQVQDIPLLDMRAVARAYAYVRRIEAEGERWHNAIRWYAEQIQADPHWPCDHAHGICDLGLDVRTIAT